MGNPFYFLVSDEVDNFIEISGILNSKYAVVSCLMQISLADSE